MSIDEDLMGNFNQLFQHPQPKPIIIGRIIYKKLEYPKLFVCLNTVKQIQEKIGYRFFVKKKKNLNFLTPFQGHFTYSN